MGFAKNYIEQYAYETQFLMSEPKRNLVACVIIPCIEEPNILPTLQSLSKAELPTFIEIDVIIVVNSPEQASSHVLEANERTLMQVSDFKKRNQKFGLNIHAIDVRDLPKKFAGAGFARKIGMDEAIRRFDLLDKPDALVINLDADSTVDDNYFMEIFNHFEENPTHVAGNIYYEHPLSGSEFSEEIYNLIYKYELHLRYYSQMLKYIKYPYSFHTLGSAFVVKANAYVKQNGMNRRQAGEDFYFLHKLTALGTLGDIVSTRVIPSARPSHRVPFGTGAFIKENNDLQNEEVYTYAPLCFLYLQELLQKVDTLYKLDIDRNWISMQGFSESLVIFLMENNFFKEIKRINNNVADLKSFRKQFFQWFNGFKLVKYFNFTVKFCPKIKVEVAASFLVNKHFDSTDDLLQYFRDLDKKRIN
ncbi:MAG: glycosyltransferase [Bacteroidales bacterium]|nr:glycosyltransferase [Bacteroidales bacterium]